MMTQPVQAEVCSGGQGEVRFASKLLELRRVRELGAKSAEYLATVVDDGTTIRKHRIAAARALLAYHQYREDRFDKRRSLDPAVVMRELFGDDAKFLEWMDRHRPALVERVERERAARLLPNGGANDDGRSEGT